MSEVCQLVCGGCGEVVSEPLAFVCPHARDGRDHVLMPELDEARVPFGIAGDPRYPERPFLRWRHRLRAWHLARARGFSDTDFIALVERLEDAIARLDRRFLVTPLLRADDIAALLAREAPVWVKDETAHVAGSHKARHLFPVLLTLEVLEVPLDRPLAIASCGNAALAAAVLARAAGRPLEVFVPEGAEPEAIARLQRFGADVRVSRRGASPGDLPGESLGDPAVAAFRAAVLRGAIPFSCQGSDNGLAIEGGETLAWEIATELAARGERLDRVFVQVGGGLLAAALSRGFEQVHRAGFWSSRPRLHAVQTAAVAPLPRAFEGALGHVLPLEPTFADDTPRERACRLERLAHDLQRSLEPRCADVRHDLASARRSLMWPWENAGHSLAHGLLDDETYDWLEVVTGMLESGGYPLVVSEAEVVGANALGVNTTSIAVDETGTVSLAGLLQLALWRVLPVDESCLVLFTGRRW